MSGCWGIVVVVCCVCVLIEGVGEGVWLGLIWLRVAWSVCRVGFVGCVFLCDVHVVVVVFMGLLIYAFCTVCSAPIVVSVVYDDFGIS